MKIRDLRAGIDGVTVEGWVVSVGEKKLVETRYGPAYVASAILEDETGRIVLNLWRRQIDLVRPGCLVRIENGFVRSYKGRLELNVGKRGRIVVLSKV